MASFSTYNRHGYSVRFSPFEPDHFAVASSQLYGLAGGGTLYYMKMTEDQVIQQIYSYDWSDGLFDIIWSTQYPNIVATSSGDGTLQLWNLLYCDKKSKPILILKGHKNEVYSIDWNKNHSTDQILSGSWDGTVKLWDINRGWPLSTFCGHSDLIYSAKFSEHIPNVFSSVSIDGILNLWNFSNFSEKPLTTITAHTGEILTCDWSKYDENLLATGASDGLIRGWDIRKLNEAIFELDGCEYAIRRLKFSPHSSKYIVSANYDFTTRIWDFEQKSDALEIITNHSEFVCGVDWSLFNQNQIVDCGWDSSINIFYPQCLIDDK